MRVRFVACLVLLVLGAGLSSYGAVHERLETHALRGAQAALERGMQASRLELREVVDEAADAATHAVTAESVAAVLARSGLERRRRAYELVDRVAADLGAERAGLGRPDLVALLDASGRVVARDGDPNQLVGRTLRDEWRSLAGVAGRETAGLETRGDDGRTYLVLGRPLAGGTLVLGYFVGDALAERIASRVGHEVVLYRDDRAIGASIDSAEQRRSFEAAALLEHAEAARAGLAGAESALVRSELHAPELPMHHARVDVGQSPLGVVLFGHPEEVSRVVGTANLLLGITAMAVLVAGWLAAYLLRHVAGPLLALERRLMAMIAGEDRVGIDLHSTFVGSLAYRIEELVHAVSERTAARPPGDAAELR